MRERVCDKGNGGMRLTTLAVELLLFESLLQFLTEERPQGNAFIAKQHIAVSRDL